LLVKFSVSPICHPAHVSCHTKVRTTGIRDSKGSPILHYKQSMLLVFHTWYHLFHTVPQAKSTRVRSIDQDDQDFKCSLPIHCCQKCSLGLCEHSQHKKLGPHQI